MDNVQQKVDRLSLVAAGVAVAIAMIVQRFA